MAKHAEQLLLALILVSAPAFARAQTPAVPDDPLATSVLTESVRIALSQAPGSQAVDPQNVRPRVAAEYSDAYETRKKIHSYASWATLPLFVGQYVIGEDLYDGESSSEGLHSALGAGIGALFGVNTVTGVWNLWEARHDANGRGRRLVHGIAMIGADAGFVATGLLAPGRNGEHRSLHRSVALTSMGIAAGSYLYMLFTR